MAQHIISKALRYAYMHGWLYRRIEGIHRRRIAAIRRRGGDDPVKVVFFAMSVSMWRYQHLYDLMSRDDRFLVHIVLSPSIDYALEQQQRDVDDLRTYFAEHGTPYVDCDLKHPVDVKSQFNPDIVFYPQPYEHLLTPAHDCTAFYDRLVCYYPYAFWTSKGKWSYDFHFHNLAWRLYYSTRLHLKEAQNTAWTKGRNVRVVGYPNADDFLARQFNDAVWKPMADGKGRKRIIWAPHYSITPEFGLVARSQFLTMAEPMLQMARGLNDEIQVAFKPHPRLLTELYRHPDWGRERADNYYRQWAEGENTQLETGGFIDLFMTSDAMVHDSGSFAVEYHYSLNPVMFTSPDLEPLLQTQSEFGRTAYKLHYLGRDMAEVEHFIRDVVIAGHDTMRSWREWFFNEHLLPPGGNNVAQNTLDDLVYSLFTEPLSDYED